MRTSLLIFFALLATPSVAAAYPLASDPGDPNERRVGTMTISGINTDDIKPRPFVMNLYGFSGGFTRSSNAGSGRMDNFTVVKHLDRGSPMLTYRTLAGIRSDKVLITLFHYSSTTPLVTYCLGHAYLGWVRPWDHGVAEDFPLEEVSFRSAGEIRQTTYNTDGTVAASTAVRLGDVDSPC